MYYTYHTHTHTHTHQVLEKGMRFTMRDGSCTLGYGVVTDLLKDTDLDAYAMERKKIKKAKKKAEAEMN